MGPTSGSTPGPGGHASASSPHGLVHADRTRASASPFSPSLILSAWQMKEFSGAFDIMEPALFVCTVGGFCMYLQRRVGGLGREGAPWRRWGQGPPLAHTFVVVVVVCLGFLHSLLSIKKPFLQPASDAHSLLLPMNDVPSSLAY